MKQHSVPQNLMEQSMKNVIVKYRDEHMDPAIMPLVIGKLNKEMEKGVRYVKNWVENGGEIGNCAFSANYVGYFISHMTQQSTGQ